MKKKHVIHLIAVFITSAGIASEETEEKLTFREPFELHLEVDGEQYYRQDINATPYVADQMVILFKGDGILCKATETPDGNLSIDFSSVVEIQKEENWAETEVPDGYIQFYFFQEELDPKKWVMMLQTSSGLDKEFTYNAHMITLSGGPKPTSIIPVGPNQTNHEMWPQPIIQLLLTDFRFTKKEEVEPVERGNSE